MTMDERTKRELLKEADWLDRTAEDIEELKDPFSGHQADKLRKSADRIRTLVHGGGTGRDD